MAGMYGAANRLPPELRMTPTPTEIVEAAKRAAIDEVERLTGRPPSAYVIGVAVEAAARVLTAVHPPYRHGAGGGDARRRPAA